MEVENCNLKPKIIQIMTNPLLCLERIKEQIEQQEASLRASHKAELLQVEERTKQLTVKFFAEEVRKLEARYKETNLTADQSLVESLHKTVLEKSNEVS